MQYKMMMPMAGMDSAGRGVTVLLLWTGTMGLESVSCPLRPEEEKVVKLNGSSL